MEALVATMEALVTKRENGLIVAHYAGVEKINDAFDDIARLFTHEDVCAGTVYDLPDGTKIIAPSDWN